ncbi:MAG: flagellar hook-basal body complex protein, partial [Proteobacteria bacterium]|nr:flagellar hook-basal body complex protein [Pseudomonadota bacterium]
MSFYTALTGLNGSQADIAATSNNIANVGTTGFKRSRAEFGDIFATSPLQNASSSIGSGSILKGVKQQFTQGNIASSLNALDLAISGQGFFALKPSLTSNQVVYTRNGSFNVDNNRNVVDSTGQFLLTYPVNDDGSVTSKSIGDAVPLQLPVTSGDPKATGKIDLAVNLPADAPVVTDNPKFADGYQFSTNDPDSFTNSTSLTIFDDLGNPTIATVYFIKTQAATAQDPTNKYDTRLVIDDTVIDPDLVASVNDNGEQIYIDRFGRETTIDKIADDNYFSEGKGAALYRRDDLNEVIPSQPARLQGSQSSFDFGEEGNKLIEITNDPMRFKATREAGNADSSIFWGKDFLLVNVDDGDVPVSIDLRPGFYNATQLADEVERAINDAYGDDNRLQVRSNVDDKITVDFSTLNTADGTLSGLPVPVEIDLLQPTYVSEKIGLDTSGSSPDFTREEFLAHAQVRVIEAMNAYENNSATTGNLGVNNKLFTRSIGAQMDEVYSETDVVTFDYKSMAEDGSDTVTKQRHLVYSYYNKLPELNVYDNKLAVANNGTISYDAPNNILTIDLPSGTNMAQFAEGEIIRLAGNFDSYNDMLNGRKLTILNTVPDAYQLRISTTGEGFPDASFTLTQNNQGTSGLNFQEAYIMSDASTDVEAFFEGESLRPQGAINSYNNKKIVLRETVTTNHTYKHNDTDFGSQAATGTMTEGVEYYVTSTGSTNGVLSNWTAGSANGNDLSGNALSSAIEGSTFRSNGVSLTGDGRVKEIFSSISAIGSLSTDLSLSSSNVVDTSGITSGAQSFTVNGVTISAAFDTNPATTHAALKSAFTTAKALSANSAALGHVTMTADDVNLTLTFTQEVSFTPGQKYMVVNTPSGNNSVDVDRDGTSETYVKGDFITLHNPVTTKFDASASQGATGFSGTASDTTLTVTSVASASGGIDVVIDGDTYTITSLGTAADTATEASRIAALLTSNTSFAAKYTATASGSDVTIAPKSVVIPSGLKVIEIDEVFGNLQSEALGGTSSLSGLGLTQSEFNNNTVWVDEKNPPIKIEYDAVNQRFQFGVNHTAIGPGTDSNFRAFKIYGASGADGTNNLGIPAPDAATSVPISSTAIITAQPFVADGGELQINAKRFGVSVEYNSDVKTFTFSSGTTGEEIAADKAIGVDNDQKASNIQVGRYALDSTNGSVVNAAFDTATRYMGAGDNGLMGVGASKNDVSFKAARGLASEPARAVGAPATEPLNEVFALSAAAADNIFNVSVNGISGIIEVPGGNYVGSTLAAELQTRINQISDSETGRVVGGVTVEYQAATNNFVFTTGTTGDNSTIKVKGAPKLGLDDVPLGVGSVPEIVNLVQATNDAGVPLYVNELGQVVETPPDNLVEDYYPLYIDEGELTFDKTGQIISPLNRVHYEQQAAGFSISLDVDYSASTQLSQPFSVNNLDQDGFTSGRLDGLDI